jgi:hypothetical protein
MSRFSDQRPTSRWSIALLLWCLAASFALSAAQDDLERADFAAYYAAASLLIQGQAARIYTWHENRTQFPADVERQMEARGYPGKSIPPYYSHPAIAMAMTPLARRDYPSAQRLWALGLLAGQFLLGLLLWRRRWLDPVEAAGLVLFMILGYAGRRALEFGQFQLAILFLVGLAVVYPARWIGALVLPPVILAKPFFIPLLLSRPRQLPWILLGFVPWLVAPLVWGREAYGAFFHTLAGRSGDFPIYASQQGLLAQTMRIVEKIPLSEEQWIHLHRPSAGSVALYVGLAIPLAAIGLWQLKRHHELPMRTAAMIATSMAVAPLIWSHYATLFVLPLVVILHSRPRPLPVGLALAGVLIANLPYRHQDPSWLFVLRFNVYAGALLQLASVAAAERTPSGSVPATAPAHGLMAPLSGA